jgi:hypothetical protein
LNAEKSFVTIKIALHSAEGGLFFPFLPERVKDNKIREIRVTRAKRI